MKITRLTTIIKDNRNRFKHFNMVIHKKINIKMIFNGNKLLLKMTIDIREKEITLYNTNKWRSTMSKVMENKKIKKLEAVTITANTLQTTDNKSKTTGKRIAIKSRNFKIMHNIIKNQKNNITKIWDSKFGIKTSKRKLTIRNSKVKTKFKPAPKELSQIKFKVRTKSKFQISQNISKT